MVNTRSSYIDYMSPPPSSSQQESSGSEWEPEELEEPEQTVTLNLVTPPPSPHPYPEYIRKDGVPFVNLLTPPSTPMCEVEFEYQEEVFGQGILSPTRPLAPGPPWPATVWAWEPAPLTPPLPLTPPSSPQSHDGRFAHLFKVPHCEYRACVEGLTDKDVQDWIAYVSVN